MTVNTLTLFACAGVESRQPSVTLARRRLERMGFSVTVDPSVRSRHQRFAGDDAARLEALHRVADAAPSVAMAVRGGYGTTRLLDAIDWERMARSVDAGTRWVGYSDLTALQLGLLAHTGRGSWHGPMATEDFGRKWERGSEAEELNETTTACFAEAMSGELEAIGFRTEKGWDGLERRGTLWGGNLAMVCSLLGTPHWPKVRNGVLFLEDVGEHPYKVERMLLQLHQAGVLARQQAILLGDFTQWRPAALDRGYTWKTAVAHLRSVCPVPVLTGLPVGHEVLKVCLPQGRRADLVVHGRDVLVAWG